MSAATTHNFAAVRGGIANNVNTILDVISVPISDKHFEVRARRNLLSDERGMADNTAAMQT